VHRFHHELDGKESSLSIDGHPDFFSRVARDERARHFSQCEDFPAIDGRDDVSTQDIGLTTYADLPLTCKQACGLCGTAQDDLFDKEPLS
jgi:hypothetical protein